MNQRFNLAYLDFKGSLKFWRVWLLFGWQDIRLRYRRSYLGPWWLTMSMLVTILCLGFLYGTLLNQPLDEYLPFLAIGLVTWSFIASLVSEGSNIFIESSSYLKQMSLPYSVFLLRMLVRNAIIFFHNIIPVIFLLIFFSTKLSLALLILPLSILVILINGFCYGWILGILGARFRDLQPIIASLMQIAFFLTPIIWSPKTLSEKYQFLVKYNPFAQFLDLIRQPLLGEWPTTYSWLFVLSVTLIGIVMMVLLIKRTRTRIIYWL
ncbi:MAG: ABC transporter permease [Gammaproteobacteria bacterium]